MTALSTRRHRRDVNGDAITRREDDASGIAAVIETARYSRVRRQDEAIGGVRSGAAEEKGLLDPLLCRPPTVLKQSCQQQPGHVLALSP